MMSVGLAGVLAMVVVMKRRIHVRFTDQGICFVGFIKWGQIVSYRWDRNPEGGEDLELHISTNGRNSNISLPISMMYRERVAEILAAHVPRSAGVE
jgi:hypothetical protein